MEDSKFATYSTVGVRIETKNRLEKLRGEDMTWNELLEKLCEIGETRMEDSSQQNTCDAKDATGGDSL